MKKVSIIFTAVLFIISIFFVGIYGNKITADNVSIYVANIECKYILLNEQTINLRYDEIENYYYVYYFDINSQEYLTYMNYDSGLEFSVYYDVYPDNATIKSASLSLSDNEYAEVLENNVVKVKDLDQYIIEKNIRWINFDVYVNSLDGSNVYSTISILLKTFIE